MKRLLPAGCLLVCAALVAAVPLLHGPSAGLRWVLSLSLAASASTMLVRGRLRDAALMLASLGFGLAAVETVALFLEKPIPTWIDSGLSAPQPYVGFGPRRAGRFATKEIAPGGRVVFDVTTTIGDDLLRVVNAPKGDGAVAFFGDSWTFGTGLRDDETIEQAFADGSGRTVPVPSLSFPGWSPAQNLATLQHGLHADELQKARRFVLMTGAWHVERTACKVDFARGAPRFRLDHGALVQDGFCFEPGRLHKVLTSFALYRTVAARVVNKLTPADVDTYMAIVQAFVRLAKERYGVDTTIIALPYLPGYLEAAGSGEAAYLAGLARTGADVFVDPLPSRPGSAPYLIPGDFHPSALANRTVATLLRDHLAAKWPDLLPKAAGATP